MSAGKQQQQQPQQQQSQADHRLQSLFSQLKNNSTAATTVPAFTTADLCDHHPNDVTLLLPSLLHYGTVSTFSGPALTLKVHEDNSLVRSTLETPGCGRVLVIDGGGSLRCALVGDQIAALISNNNWSGVIVYGCIRDSELIQRMKVAVRAIGTAPVKSIRRGTGVSGIAIQFGHGVIINTGDFIYGDADGILVSKKQLLQ